MKVDMEKYTLAFMQQKLKRDKEVMFRAKPGSKRHTNAVIKFDRNRVDLECLMVQLGYSYRRKRSTLKYVSEGKKSPLPFVYKPL